MVKAAGPLTREHREESGGEHLLCKYPINVKDSLGPFYTSSKLRL